MTQFNALGLAEPILNSIENEGFDAPTPIQAKAIPPLMEGLDVMGLAQTGGGKTAAFSLPMIHRLHEDYERPTPNKPKVLILAPTRELAQQIGLCIETFSKGTKIKSLVISGGQPYPPQTNRLRRGVDILIATPGRLNDHVRRQNVKFDETEVLILDEADRMLDMGFIDEVTEIAASLHEDHQTVLFSATMNHKVRNLSKQLLTDPVYVEIEQKSAVADTIDHKLMGVTRKNKRQLLIDILSGEDVTKALVFSRTKGGADDLSDALYDAGIRSDAIHGDKRQRVREKILMSFRRGRTEVLVATDVAARGIDVDGISHVINFEMPIEPENYVHRVGRTGRAGAKGTAISFCDPSDVRLLKNIEQLIKQPIEVDTEHEYHIDLTMKRAPQGRGGRPSYGRGERGGRGRDDRGGRSDRGDRGFREKRNDSRSDSRSDSRRPAARDDFKRSNRDGYRDNNRDAPREQKREWTEERPQNGQRSDRPRSDRPSNDRPRNDRPRDGQREDRPRADRPRSDRPRADRPQSGQRSDRPRNDRPREDRPRSDRPQSGQRSDRPRGDRPESRRSFENRNDAPKQQTPRYDPWKDSQGFEADPVMKKLAGKAPAIKAKKKTEGSDFVKPAKKKAYKKKGDVANSFGKFAPSKKTRGGKKTLSLSGAGKPGGAFKGNGPKSSGGNKPFSPKRKPNRAA